MTISADSVDSESSRAVKRRWSKGPLAKRSVRVALTALLIILCAPLVVWSVWVGYSESTSRRDGTPAVARVDRLEDGFCWVSFEESSCVVLLVSVFPEGDEPFRAELKVSVEDRWLPKIQPGSYVRVLRDREEPSKVYLNKAALANAPPRPPATAAETPPPG